MPHTMKKIIFCAITLALVLLGACKKNEEPQSSPRIYLSYFTVHYLNSTSEPDTLGVTTVDNIYVVDSVSVGDTVHVDILLNAVTNILTGFTVKTDTTILKPTFVMYKDLENALTAESDLNNGIFKFQTGYSGATIPMNLIVRASGAPNVTLTVTSDSQYSPGELIFKQPVR